jgi:hypothetical protein
MPVVYPGATLTPHFRDFLPDWVTRQPWYRGSGQPSLRMIGAFRFEDPAGQVGIETHLVTDGATLYQVPMTYRGAALAGVALISTTEHSVLGRRWIYDGTTDPVWVAQLLQLVADEGVSGPSGKGGIADAQARGLRLSQADPTAMATNIDLRRVLTAGPVPAEPGVGVVMGSWSQPGSPPESHVHGCLAVVRELGRRRA